MRPALLLALILATGACAGTAAPAPAPPPPEKTLQLNRPGEPVDIAAHLVPGYVTVVDFWGEHCAACIVVGGMLAVQTALDPRVVIRKVDVGDGFTAVAKAYEIGALPHYRVYDKHKRLRYYLTGNDCLQAPEIAKQLAAEP